MTPTPHQQQSPQPPHPVPQPQSPSAPSGSLAPQSEEPPHPAPTHPALSLWELMRKEATPTPDDPTSRVLTATRPSIWDL